MPKLDDIIDGAPLKSLRWNSENHTVKVVFRKDTDLLDRQRFFVDLAAEVTRLTGKSIRISGLRAVVDRLHIFLVDLAAKVSSMIVKNYKKL